MHLSLIGIIGSIIIGAIVGWLAGKIMSGKGFGLVVDTILGVISGLIVGLVVGVWLGDNSLGWIARFVLSLIVACVIVGGIHLVKGERIRTA